MESLHCRLRCLATLSLALCLCAASARGVEFIVNGTFEGGGANVGLSGPLDGAPDWLPNGWSRVETFSGNVAESSMHWWVAMNGPSAPGVVAMEFVRWAGDNSSGDWTAIEQPLNIRAADYSSLWLSADVMVLSHDLEAGGWVNPAFEWPAIVEIDYLDTLGNPQVWRYGWFVDPPGDFVSGQVDDPGQGLIPIYDDLLVQPGQWVPNFFDLFAELPEVDTITNIRVGGSGWLYHSVLDNISLQGEAIPEPGSLTLLALGCLALSARRRRRA